MFRVASLVAARPLVHCGRTLAQINRPASLASRLIEQEGQHLVKTATSSMRYYSTSTTVTSTDKPMNFNDTKNAYQSKSNYELFRNWLVLEVCSVPFIVQNADKLIHWSQKILGKKLTFFMIRHTFFAQFCAGEHGGELAPTLERLKSHGVGAILDYAAENDVDESAGGVKREQEREGVISARVYDYGGEEECDKNLEVILKCIRTAASESGQNGIAAVKLTALGNPILLERMSDILMSIKKLWVTHFADAQHLVNIDEFRKGLQRMGVSGLSDPEIESLFKAFDKDNDRVIDYIEWTGSLQLEDFSTRQNGSPNGKANLAKTSHLPMLDAHETELMDKMIARLRKAAEEARTHKVRLLIDAEQTYMQPVIDHFTYNLQKEYNKSFPLIFNTYQCYLTYSRMRIQNDLERAKREGFWFAGKLVRGAYMIQERKRAQERGETSPICNTIEETHSNYNYNVDQVLKEIHRANVLVASHNQTSIELTVQKMKEYGIPKTAVFFGQLLGMADHLSFTLGQSGFQAYKYVPYGPIDKVIPYLVRRAQENSGMMVNAQHEKKMLWDELKRRKFFGKP